MGVGGNGALATQVIKTKKREFQYQQIDQLQQKKNQILQPNQQNKKEIAATKIFRFLYKIYKQYYFNNHYLRKEKQHRYRNFVIEELINTERNYLNDLKLLIVIQSQVKQWLNKQQIEIIFNNLQQLYELNSSFLQDLEGFLPYNRSKLLGPIIKGLAPFFKVYFPYYEGFNKSMATLKQCINDKEDFRKFLKNMSSIKDYNNQDIDSFLIKPVQRIPKYNLLLEDLIKHTDKIHPDYKNLCESLELFKNINDDNNKNMDKFLSSKLFDMEKWFGNKLSQKLVDTKRKYITELLTSILDQTNKVIIVTAFILSDLIIIGERQENQYQYIQSVFLDEQSGCLDVENQQHLQNIYILQGMRGQSITFIEQTPNDKIEKMAKLQKIIQECKEKSKYTFQRQTIRAGSEIKVQLNKIKVTVLGLDERHENLSSYKVYIIEVGIEEVFQKLFLRFSQCIKIQDYIKKKYPTTQLNFLKQNTTLSLLNDQKEIESRMIAIPLFVQSVLISDITRQNPQILKDLGLPENFYDLPSEADNFRNQRTGNQKAPDRFNYVTPTRTLIKTFDYGNDQQSLQSNQCNRRLLSASSMMSRNITLVEEKKKQKEKDAISIIVNHAIPKEKPWEFNVKNNTKVLHVLDQIQKVMQLQQIYDFKLYIYDNKSRVKILQNDENICDLFGDSFIFAKKKKELWFKKLLYQDIEYEKTLLQADSARMKLLYYQLVKDIQISTLPFPTQNQYIKLAAIHLYLQNCNLSYNVIQQIIPSSILQLKQREYWNCVVTQEFKEFKSGIQNTQSTLIQINETEDIAKAKSKGIFSSIIQSNQNQFSQIENVNVDSTKVMIQFIQECLKNEFCIQQLFSIVCKETLTLFGEQNLFLGIGYHGIRLYSSSKDRIWEKIDKPQSFNVFPGSIEIGFKGRKLKFETNQGFQIQSLFDEYQAIKSQNQE
ncbi:unnamed protein product (macronuclear) [Paramecium tetraurelia]|uniref:DH domain-containing protein n=1 Tax=Paramecium tetraurelia TaxID=5888 RepID=A0CZ33_PARTE|nr:uncharacterized protein GSPATT00011651001 [Paramecium tetraurelia]CAK76050.1 unnamed protein product [Paramecium tetraurelia]|eukprot:XP_001443447.1 hypothetical protein (macronuclear) [Paramecium tetraurelia strain d4-2]